MKLVIWSEKRGGSSQCRQYKSLSVFDFCPASVSRICLIINRLHERLTIFLLIVSQVRLNFAPPLRWAAALAIIALRRRSPVYVMTASRKKLTSFAQRVRLVKNSQQPPLKFTVFFKNILMTSWGVVFIQKKHQCM